MSPPAARMACVRRAQRAEAQRTTRRTFAVFLHRLGSWRHSGAHAGALGAAVSPCAAEPARPLRHAGDRSAGAEFGARIRPDRRPGSPSGAPHDRPPLGQRRPAAPWRARAALARRTDDAARRGHHASHRDRIRARRVPAPARPSLLVPVVRRGHGHGLALVGDHDLGDRGAEARARSAFRRARPPCLRRSRRAFAQDPA